MVVFALPFLIGRLFRTGSISFHYLCGQLLLWAIFQVIAVPCVYYRMSFNTLFWIYTCVVLMLAVVGIWFLCFRQKPRRARGSRESWRSPFLIIAVLVIAYQMYQYVFGMHLDEDDARWIAEANDALVKNRMMLYNPATGEYIGRFVGEMIKDVFSPWSMMYFMVFAS